MSDSTFVHDGTQFRRIRKIFINDGVAPWRTVRNTWVKDNDGTWKLVYVNTFFYTETISTNTNRYSLNNALTAAGWNGTDHVDATVTISPGVTVYSSVTGTAAFRVNPALPSLSSVTLINQGTIVGKAGAGGDGGDVAFPGTTDAGSNGLGGGQGIRVLSPITINNTGGVIAGGGGGGGGGGSARNTGTNPKVSTGTIVGGSGGGGGGGSPLSVGAAGAAGTATLTPSPTVIIEADNGTAGNAGTTSGGALRPGVTNPWSPGSPASSATGGSGAAGGARGAAGGTGGTSSTSGTASVSPPTVTTTAGGSGGAAGAAINGNSLVTLPGPQTGTINGPRIN